MQSHCTKVESTVEAGANRSSFDNWIPAGIAGRRAVARVALPRGASLLGALALDKNKSDTEIRSLPV